VEFPEGKSFHMIHPGSPQNDCSAVAAELRIVELQEAVQHIGCLGIENMPSFPKKVS
jgi:hypothetical protein